MKKKDILLGVLLVLLILCALGIGYLVLKGKFDLRSHSGEAGANLKALADRATAWYARQHTTPEGIVLPGHFPRLDTTNAALQKSISVTLPKEKPCHNGKAKYPKNSAQWNVEPWISLRFKIQKPHYFQYTYIARGSGAASTAILRAQADLDCDGKLSTYTIRLKIDKGSGVVTRSNLVITNAHE